MTKRLSFLLLDANIIIELWRLPVEQGRRSFATSTSERPWLVKPTSSWNASGNHVAIDLSADIASQRIRVFQVEFSELAWIPGPI